MTFLRLAGNSILLFLIMIIGKAPRFIQKGIANLVFIVLSKITKYRKKVIIDNLQSAFPNKTPEQLKVITNRYYRNLSYMMIENCMLRFSNAEKIKKDIIINNQEIIERLREKNKDILIVTGHSGNWEYGGMFAGLFNYHGLAVYKKLNSAFYEHYFYCLRSNLGAQPVEMNNVMRGVLELKKKNEPFILFLIADQSPMRHEINYWIKFLNRETGVYLGPEKLAKKFDMPVVYVESMRQGFGKFIVKTELITEHPLTTAPYEIIDRFYKLLENGIHKHPDNWLWSHRRWKHSKPA